MLRFLPLIVALAGCKISVEDPGTDPPARSFYFPVGVAFDKVTHADGSQGRYLYIANGNADLRYGGGALQIVDIKRFECAAARFCESNGCAMRRNPDCDDTQADKDLFDVDKKPRCQLDPIDPSMVDCDEEPFVLGSASVRLGNFAGAIRVLDRGNDQRRLFVAVRGDPSVTWVDVDLKKLAPNQEPKPGEVLDCFIDDAALPSRPGYNQVPLGCDSDTHLLQSAPCVTGADCKQEEPPLPGEPFGMALDQGSYPGSPTPQPYAHLLVSHLATGEVTLIDANVPTVLDVSTPFFQADATGRRGAFSLAPQRAGDPASSWYMTSNLQPAIATFRVAQVGLVVPSTGFSVGGPFALGIDSREIVFEPGGNRAFITQNNPPSVMVLDTRLGVARTPGQALNQVVDIVNVCQTPSRMGVRRIVAPGAQGAPARIKTQLYVVCFLSSQIMVVDPDAPGVEATVVVGRGPNEATFNFADLEEVVEPRAYVTHFSEMTVGVVDLRRLLDDGMGGTIVNPHLHRMVARLGRPVPPVRR